MTSLINRIKNTIYTLIARTRAKRVCDCLSRYFLKAKLVLDVGCGDMIITEYLQEKLRCKIIGLDVIDDNLTNLSPVIYDGKTFPFPDNSFDLVYAIFSLHHCQNQNKVLSEMKRVTKKQIIVIEEIYNNILEKYYLFFHDWLVNRLESFSINIPFKFNTEAEWMNIFEKNNLKLVECRNISLYPWYITIPLLTFASRRLYVANKI